MVSQLREVSGPSDEGNQLSLTRAGSQSHPPGGRMAFGLVSCHFWKVRVDTSCAAFSHLQRSTTEALDVILESTSSFRILRSAALIEEIKSGSWIGATGDA